MWVVLGFQEVWTRKFIKAVLSEFLATAILIVAGCGSCLTMDAGKPLSTLTTALTFAMTVAYIVWTFNHLSGAHINPVVTLGFLVTGQGTIARTIAYTIAQCAGAIAGSVVLWFIVPVSWRGTIATTVLNEDVSTAQGFAIEAVSTFMLMLGVFSCGDRYRTDHEGSVPLTVGLMVFVQSAWAVYWVAPTIGSIAGSLLYHHVLAESPPNIQVPSLTVSTNETKEKSTKSLEVDRIATIGRLKEGFDNPALELNSS